MPHMIDYVSDSDIWPLPAKVVFGDVSYNAGASFGPRIQPDVQLVLIISGSLRVRVNQTNHHVAAGHVICQMPGGEEHYRFDRHQPTEHTWVSLTYGGLPPSIAALLRDLPPVAPFAPGLDESVRLGIQLQYTARPAPWEAMRRLALACLLLHVQDLDPQRVSSSDRRVPTPVARALAYVDQQLSHPMSLDNLANAACVSPAHLTRLFRQHVDCTPMAYVWRRRTERGANLLRNTGLSISEVAYQVGFVSPHHFSRLMRQHTGKSPRQLRQSSWHSDAG